MFCLSKQEFFLGNYLSKRQVGRVLAKSPCVYIYYIRLLHLKMGGVIIKNLPLPPVVQIRDRNAVSRINQNPPPPPPS